MDITVRVKRQDPEATGEGRLPYWQEYPVSIPETATVLDALIQIREDDDGTLSLRCFLPQRHLRFLRDAYQRPRRARLQDNCQRRGAGRGHYRGAGRRDAGD